MHRKRMRTHTRAHAELNKRFENQLGMCFREPYAFPYGRTIDIAEARHAQNLMDERIV